MALLKAVRFQAEDTLYILGDIVDRGKHPIKVLLEIMKYPNIQCIAGNHEVMALTCLQFLRKEITEDSVASLDEENIGKLLDWQQNGGQTTMEEFHKLGKELQEQVMEYLEEFSLYEEVEIGDTEYVLVHAGLDQFDPARPLYDYDLEELVWHSPDYQKVYFSDRILITGHLPTQLIDTNPRPGYVFQKNNHLAIDCGAYFGGRLAMVCLDTGEIYYSDEIENVKMSKTS